MELIMEDEGPTIRPSLKDMENFVEFIKNVEMNGFDRYGALRVVPSPEFHENFNYTKHKIWSLRKTFTPLELDKLKTGCYRLQLGNKKKSLSVKLLKSKNEAMDSELEFWNSPSTVDQKPVYYGINLEGPSLFPKALKIFNLNCLGTILDEQKMFQDLPGITSPTLFIGQQRTAFGWHIEDKGLYSILYHHIGHPKIWNVIAPSQSQEFEMKMRDHFPNDAKRCASFIAHKASLTDPEILQPDIKVTKIIQREGDFVITFPLAYHQGFNSGFNVCEGVNFASESWVHIGLNVSAAECVCGLREGQVVIRMDHFKFKYGFKCGYDIQNKTNALKECPPHMHLLPVADPVSEDVINPNICVKSKGDISQVRCRKCYQLGHMAFSCKNQKLKYREALKLSCNKEERARVNRKKKLKWLERHGEHSLKIPPWTMPK